MQLPLLLDPGCKFEVEWGNRRYAYEIEAVDENIVTITDLTTDRGTFDVDEYEISDMLNSATRVAIER